MSLSILIWLPLVIGLLCAWLPPRLVGRVSAAASVITLAIAISFVARFKLGQSGLQFTTDKVWISALGIHYKIGLDGLNVALVLLTTVIFTAALAWAALRDWERPGLFFFWFGLAESAVLGAFCAQDLALFVAFFDLMLVPFVFLIISWGSGERTRAAIKLLIYTLIGSFFMLVGAIATGVVASSRHGTGLTFVLSSLQHLPLSHASQDWIFLCFAIAFLVKMPLVPFHGWLAEGYKSMPIPAVAVFSAVLSKVAAYGFLRVVLPLFPYASVHYQTLILVIALISILWGTAVAFTTNDARLVVAYSSVAQLGFIVLGIFSLRPEGGQGALLQMLNHALVTAPLFFIVAALAARAGGSEDIRSMGGEGFRAPVLAALFLIASLATLAMPGSSNFIGEFMILLGVFKAKLAIALVASLGIAGAAYYALRLFISTMHNRLRPGFESLDIRLSEAVAIVPLLGVIVVLALYPQFGLRRSEPTLKSSIAGVQSVQATSTRLTASRTP
ncbi:MAG TPA: NADH-quinone oxidoreductase subunit M [Solirubrobacteraceae bacterium]|jgi:NADH-quinone oxidoreductase subunit M